MRIPTAVTHTIPISCQVTDLPSYSWIHLILLIIQIAVENTLWCQQPPDNWVSGPPCDTDVLDSFQMQHLDRNHQKSWTAASFLPLNFMQIEVATMTYFKMHFNGIIYFFFSPVEEILLPFTSNTDRFNLAECWTILSQTMKALKSVVKCQGRTTQMNKTAQEERDPRSGKPGAVRAFSARRQHERGPCEPGVRCAHSCKISILRNLEERSSKHSSELFFNFIWYLLTSFEQGKMRKKINQTHFLVNTNHSFINYKGRNRIRFCNTSL